MTSNIIEDPLFVIPLRDAMLFDPTTYIQNRPPMLKRYFQPY